MIHLTNQHLSDEELKRIGKGIQYPDSLSVDYQKANISQGLDRINQSIYIILSTPVGRNLGNRNFGSKLYNLIFEQNDSTFVSLARLYVNDALGRWEPRIKVTSIDVNQDPAFIDANIVFITINYLIVASHTPGNLVYPFYKDYNLLE